MIRLKKLPEPAILVSKQKELTELYVDSINKGEAIPAGIKKTYKLPAIKNILLQETFGKCAYCESKITHICPGDVEHFKPKRCFPELIFAWPNLTITCPKCNVKKGDYFSEKEPLINPFVDNPDKYIYALGAMLYPKHGSNKGIITIEILGLNRAALLERRLERIEYLEKIVHLYHMTSDKTLKTLLKQQMMQEIELNKEYVMATKSYLISSGVFPKEKRCVSHL